MLCGHYHEGTSASKARRRVGDAQGGAGVVAPRRRRVPTWAASAVVVGAGVGAVGCRRSAPPAVQSSVAASAAASGPACARIVGAFVGSAIGDFVGAGVGSDVVGAAVGTNVGSPTTVSSACSRIRVTPDGRVLEHAAALASSPYRPAGNVRFWTMGPPSSRRPCVVAKASARTVVANLCIAHNVSLRCAVECDRAYGGGVARVFREASARVTMAMAWKIERAD